MSISAYYTGSILAENLALDTFEVAARLGTDRAYKDEIIYECEKELRDVLDCRYSALKADVEFLSDNMIDLGFAEIKSGDLNKNLAGCREAYVFAVTIGHGADRLIKKLSVISPAKHFVTDALASAFAEAACDHVAKILAGENECRARFSPGYGDLPLSLQSDLLGALNASRVLGISLSKALLMSPSKSITAIMGIKLRD